MENDNITIRETHIFFIIFILGYIGAATLAGMLLPDNASYWMIICVNSIVIILPVVVIMVARKIRLKSFMMFEKIGIKDIVMAYAGAYTLLPLINLINYCSSFFVRNHVTDMMEKINLYPLWAQLILLAVFPAVTEEFIFRGFFYGHYRKKNIIKAMLMSGLFFGIAHLNINQFAYAFVIGAAFCLLYEVSGNIILPMTAHFAINANTIFQMQWLNSLDEEVINEAVGTVSNMQMQTGEIVINIASLFGMSVLFTTLFMWMVFKIANRHNRLAVFSLLKNISANSKDKEDDNTDGVKEELFVDIYWVLAVVPPVIYMVMLEMI